MVLTIVEPRGTLLNDKAIGDQMPIQTMAARMYSLGSLPFTCEDMVERAIDRGLEVVWEHVVASAAVVCSRVCSHQLVRHRLASISQRPQVHREETTVGLPLVCPPTVANLSPGKYAWTGKYWDFTAEGSEGAVLLWDMDVEESAEDYAMFVASRAWLDDMRLTYMKYLGLIDRGVPPGDARYVLPGACATELIMTANLREWRFIFKNRALNLNAAWEIKAVTRQVLRQLAAALPDPLFARLIKELDACEQVKL